MQDVNAHTHTHIHTVMNIIKCNNFLNIPDHTGIKKGSLQKGVNTEHLVRIL